MDDDISATFGMNPINLPDITRDKKTGRALAEPELIARVVDPSDDYEYARKNIKAVIEMSTPVLPELIDLAKRSMSEKMFAEVSKLIFTLVESNKSLLDIRKTDVETERRSGNDERGGTSVTNNLFVGSTAELLNFIKNRGK